MHLSFVSKNIRNLFVYKIKFLVVNLDTWERTVKYQATQVKKGEVYQINLRPLTANVKYVFCSFIPTTLRL